MLVSHFVLREVLKALEKDKKEELKSMCDKISERYPKDEEAGELCKQVKKYIKKTQKVKKKKLEKELEDLISTRKLESSGGAGLWYKDRRAREGQRSR